MSSIKNDGYHIVAITNSTECKAHGAEKGQPCWWVPPGSTHAKTYLLALCGRRIKAAGYNGTISPASYRSKNKPNFK